MIYKFAGIEPCTFCILLIEWRFYNVLHNPPRPSPSLCFISKNEVNKDTKKSEGYYKSNYSNPSIYQRYDKHNNTYNYPFFNTKRTILTIFNYVQFSL